MGKLCKSMAKIDDFGLASKMARGANRKAIDGYRDILDAVLCDGRVDPEERLALNRYRTRHGIPMAEHYRLLKECDWTDDEWEDGIKASTWSSLGKIWKTNHERGISAR